MDDIVVRLRDYKNCNDADIDEAADTIEKLRTQLPEGMKHCTIKFIQCEKGHGRLTADNWVDHGCPWCRMRKAVAILKNQE